MRLLVDACLFVPPVMRAMLLGAAGQGGFVPLWSARILEEWARVARRRGAEAAVRAEIEGLRAAWPGAEVAVPPELEAGLALPDPGDVHVLAAAIAGGAEAILTANARDFPARTLGRHGLYRREPDGLLSELAKAGLELRPLAEAVRAEAGSAAALRSFLKRAGLPRLGKALG